MKIKFCDQDRALIAIAQNAIPWTGGEAGVLARFRVGEVLELEAHVKRLGEIEVAKLSRAPSFVATLTPEELEGVVFLLGGGGQALTPQAAPLCAAAIRRIRAQCPRPKAEAPKAP